jgi:hypothetical protein
MLNVYVCEPLRRGKNAEKPWDSGDVEICMRGLGSVRGISKTFHLLTGKELAINEPWMKIKKGEQKQ